MSKSFECHRYKFFDNQTDAGFNAAVMAWLNGLNIGNDHAVYSITTEHFIGYWVVIIICEA